MSAARSAWLLVPLVAIVGSCGQCPDSLWGDLNPIQGDKVAPFPEYPATWKRARSLAEDAVARAASEGMRSWEGATEGEVRSYTWDVVAMAAALHGKERHADAHSRVVAELIRREMPDGSWPEVVVTGGQDLEPALAGYSESAAALALLGSLAAEGLVIPGLSERIRKGLKWLEATWRPDGGLPIVPRSRRLSTEGIALATMAGLALRRGCSYCEDRAVEATRLLTGTLWLKDHFARGIILGHGEVKDSIDRDSTGPHTHNALAALALLEARRVLGERAPSPADYDPGPWLIKHFSRVAAVGSGVKASGLGGRLVLQDRTGLLYGCTGGIVSRDHGKVTLRCPDETLKVAEPITCPSPYTRCGSDAVALPPGSRPLDSVDARVTLMGAIMALGLGKADDAAAWLNAALAMQRPDGAVVAVAGQPRSAPDSALRYPHFHPRAHYGATGLLAAALDGRNPFLPGRVLAKKLPGSVSPPLASARKLRRLNLGLLPEPASGWVAAAEPGLLHLQSQTREEGWVTWSTPFRGDLSTPAACWQLRADFSGVGPWDTLQIKAEDARGLTHGLNLPGLVGKAPYAMNLSLARLGVFWVRGGDPGTTFRPGKFSLGVLTRSSDRKPGVNVLLKARRLALVPGDCLEGAPVRFRRGELTLEGAGGKLPVAREVEVEGKRAVKLSYDIQEPGAWQRVTINDRWRWSCARVVRLRYRSDQRTRVQLVVEDGQLGGGYKKGSRFYAEGFLSKTDRWLEWRVPVAKLRPFNPKDLRLLDGARLRKVSIAFPSVERAARKGTVTLLSLDALARPDQLKKDGSCR